MISKKYAQVILPIRSVQENLLIQQELTAMSGLYDRWLYYQTNWLKNPEGVKDNNSYMVERYITDFNKQIADTELVGLHAGLIKQGRYSESDRQQYLSGSSIRHAANRRFCVGDAYSTGSGTITGKGTVNGSLYNDGRVQAGSYGSIENMQVRGRLQRQWYDIAQYRR